MLGSKATPKQWITRLRGKRRRKRRGRKRRGGGRAANIGESSATTTTTTTTTTKRKRGGQRRRWKRKSKKQKDEAPPFPLRQSHDMKELKILGRRTRCWRKRLRDGKMRKRVPRRRRCTRKTRDVLVHWVRRRERPMEKLKRHRQLSALQCRARRQGAAAIEKILKAEAC